MYFTDESMDEWGAALDDQAAIEQQQRLDTEVAEDLERQEREAAMEQMYCEHRNTGDEPTSRNPFAPMMRVCYDCGMMWR